MGLCGLIGGGSGSIGYVNQQRARRRPRGVRQLTFDNGDDDSRRGKAEPLLEQDNESPPPAKPSRKQAGSPELGRALRNAYDRTIQEQIPPEMLDLLGKLG